MLSNADRLIWGLVIGWYFAFAYDSDKLSSFHSIISDGVANGMRRNGNDLILPTPIPNKTSEEQNVIKFVCLYEQNVMKFVISRGNCIANRWRITLILSVLINSTGM